MRNFTPFFRKCITWGEIGANNRFQTLKKSKYYFNQVGNFTFSNIDIDRSKPRSQLNFIFQLFSSFSVLASVFRIKALKRKGFIFCSFVKIFKKGERGGRDNKRLFQQIIFNLPPKIIEKKPTNKRLFFQINCLSVEINEYLHYQDGTFTRLWIKLKLEQKKIGRRKKQRRQNVFYHVTSKA